MVSFEEARHMILLHVPLMESESVEIVEALGRVVAEDVVAGLNLPPFDNSAMDGFAVRIEDCQKSTQLNVSDYVPAGAAGVSEVLPGNAVRIMTGAPVPTDCDTIVPIEHVKEIDDAGAKIQITKIGLRKGQHVRLAGEDLKFGETAIPLGTPISVPAVSILASLGRTHVQVYRRPTIAILSTGDELIEPGQPLPKDKLYNSNSALLAVAVREAGAVPVILGIARDDRESLREKILEGLQADALITAAGVSVGDRDFVREILAELGVKELFWKVNMKPGKAMAFGMNNGSPVFSLPGNPVAAMITFELLVRPAIMEMMGHWNVVKPLVKATLQEGMKKAQGKVVFSRVRLERANGKLLAWNAGNQDTGIMRTLLRAHALAVLPADHGSYIAGEEIDVHVLTSYHA